MALVTIEGVYRNGKIEMAEQPAATEETQVIITFLPKIDAAKTENERRKEAGKRLVESMRAGINFGGGKFNREEIYEERMNELEARRDRQ